MARHPHNVFAYWHGDRADHLDAFIQEWRGIFPQFILYDDAAARPLVKKYFPHFADVYDAINIPAAKSDIARLALLHEHGGLYVDCHCGIGNVGGINAAFDLLSDHEAIVIDRAIAQKPRPADEHFFINAILFFRRHSPLTYMIARQALANLAVLKDCEDRYGWIPYHIATLSGPGVLTAVMLQPASGNREIRQDYHARVHVIREESSPIIRNRHRTYSAPGQHWSDRQKTERLFSTP